MPFTIALVTAAALALAGCTANASRPDDAKPRPSATPKGQVIDLLPIADGSVAATGDFGTSGPIRGSLTVVKEGDDYRLDLQGFEAPVDVDLAVTAQAAATSPGCFDRWRLSFGEPTTWSGLTMFRVVRCTSISSCCSCRCETSRSRGPHLPRRCRGYPSGAGGTCVLTTLAAASLHWLQPNLRPDLRASDAGPSQAPKARSVPTAPCTP